MSTSSSNKRILLVLSLFLITLPIISQDKSSRENNLRRISAMIDGIQCERPGVKALHDGPINPSLWFSRVDAGENRVLFLLKNGYDYSGKDQGGYNICDGKRQYESLQDVRDDQDGPTTYIPMIYICNMLEREAAFSQVNVESTDAFSTWKSSTAWVNVDKELRAGGWDTDKAKLQRAANLNFDVLRLQINTYCPNIIICGSTLEFFLKTVQGGYQFFDYQIPIGNQGVMPHSRNRKYYYNDKVIIFDAYHPSYTAYNNPTIEQYCNDIVSAIRKWQEEYQ